jgi:hypothetical protein
MRTFCTTEAMCWPCMQLTSSLPLVSCSLFPIKKQVDIVVLILCYNGMFSTWVYRRELIERWKRMLQQQRHIGYSYYLFLECLSIFDRVMKRTKNLVYVHLGLQTTTTIPHWFIHIINFVNVYFDCKLVEFKRAEFSSNNWTYKNMSRAELVKHYELENLAQTQLDTIRTISRADSWINPYMLILFDI